MVLRQKLWIDRSVQGVLIGRVVLYWTIGILYVSMGSACFQYYKHPDWSFSQHISTLFEQFWPWIPSLILFMPLVIHDIIRMSHLFAGPIHRLRMHLAELANDPDCRPLTFRDDDYWQDLVVPINQLQDEIRGLRLALKSVQVAPPTEPESTPPAPASQLPASQLPASQLPVPELSVSSLPEIALDIGTMPAIGMEKGT